MKRLICFILALMLPALALALELDEDTSSVLTWPENTDEANAVLVYSMTLPHAAGDGQAAASINETFSYLVQDTANFKVPIIGELLEGSTEASHITVTYQVTCRNEDVLSVLLTTDSDVDGDTAQTFAGYTFSLAGENAGSVVSLPRLMGLLPDSGSDTWLEERQTERVNTAVRSLVWERLPDAGVTLPDWLDEESFAWFFYPEDDFYLDENGDPVFYVNAEMITDDETGMLVFPVSMEEIEDEL